MLRIKKYGEEVAAKFGFGKSRREPTSIAIYKAAKSGQTARLEELLLDTLEFPDRQSLVDTEDLKGRTPLIVAVVQGQIDCAALLLSYGADVHHMNWNPRGGTALHEAIQAWTPRNVIMLLLQYGASPFMENIAKKTPWEMATRRRDSSLFREFERYGKFCSYLLMKVADSQDGKVNWVRRWISIVPRYAYSRTSREKLYLSTWLLVFEDASFFESLFQLRIDATEAWMKPDQDIGTEVILTPPTSDASQIQNHLLMENGKGRLNLSGSDKELSLLMKAVTGQIPQTLLKPKQLGHSFDDDLVLAKRLQAEFDRDILNNEVKMHQPSQSSGAGPSTSGTSHEHDVSDPIADKTNMATQSQTSGIDVGQSSSQSKQRIPEKAMQDLCVVCLDAQKSAGFAHGNSVHWCVCKKCAEHMWRSGDRCCPLCRMSVDNIITDFYAN